MKQLTKKEILDVMRYAGDFQREVFQLYNTDLIEITKYKNCLSISVHYSLDVVSFHALCHLFIKHFKNYRKFIYMDGCYSSIVGNIDCAHFELKFYA